MKNKSYSQPAPCSLHPHLLNDLVPAGRGTHRKRPDRSGRPDDPRGNARQLLPRCLRRSKRRQSAQRRRNISCRNGTPFFTHVILFASNIRGDASGNVHNYNNPNNAAILANPAKYIAPLQAKGIKVIMGNLGDHTGAGFANLPQHKSVLTRMIWLPTTIS